MKFQKITDFLNTMLRSGLCDFSDAYIVVKGNISVDKKTFTANDFNAPNNTAAANATATNAESWLLNTMLHLSTTFQKLMECKLTTQKI